MAIETWRDWLTPSSITATDEDADWPASHLGLRDFERAYRATGTGAVTITFNFAAPVNARCLQIQRPNWPSATLKDKAGNTIGTLTTVTDELGIRRAFLAFDETDDQFTLEIPNDTALDGAAYWQAGTARFMETYEQLDVPGFLEPFTDRAVEPGEVATLPHGGKEETILGAVRAVWEGTIRRSDTVDIRKLRRLAREQDVIVRPWDEDKVTIPMRNYELDRPRTFDRAVRHSETIRLEEV